MAETLEPERGVAPTERKLTLEDEWNLAVENVAATLSPSSRASEKHEIAERQLADAVFSLTRNGMDERRARKKVAGDFASPDDVRRNMRRYQHTM